ncbi:MAG TPA: HNH endonuclease, partial [Anaeromyxobacter sp.]
TRDALSHSHPGASTEEILLACMQLMLDRKAKEKGLVERPLETPRPCRPERIPAHVRREVMKRSGGRCEWVFENGERCNSTWQIEVDHLDPKALGGEATVERCRAACRPHNLLAARRVFGDAWMDRYAPSGRRAAARPKRSLRTKPADGTGTGDGG